MLTIEHLETIQKTVGDNYQLAEVVRSHIELHLRHTELRAKIRALIAKTETD